MFLDVVTPRGRLLSEVVVEVTAPGVLGEFGVLPGHVPFLTGMKPGVLRWRTSTGAAEGRLAVGPGFVEVAAGDRVVVLAELGVRVGDIDVAVAEKERFEAQSQLDHFESDNAGLRADLEAKKAWAEARLATASEGAVATH